MVLARCCADRDSPVRGNARPRGRTLPPSPAPPATTLGRASPRRHAPNIASGIRPSSTRRVGWPASRVSEAENARLRTAVPWHGSASSSTGKAAGCLRRCPLPGCRRMRLCGCGHLPVGVVPRVRRRYAVVGGVRVVRLDARGRAGIRTVGEPYRFRPTSVIGTRESRLALRRSRHGMPAGGDLLCFSRGQSARSGRQGMRNILEPRRRLVEHALRHRGRRQPGGDGKLYPVGGNVLQGVTMRALPLNRGGAIWGLPRTDTRVSSARPGSRVQLQSPGLGGVA